MKREGQWNEYLKNLECYPADELFLTIFARMREIHIGVLMRDYYWTTARQICINQCEVVMGFAGNHNEGRFTFPVLFDTEEKIIERPPPTPSPPKIVSEVAHVLATLRYPVIHEGNENGADLQSATDHIQSGMEVNNGTDIQSGTEGNDGADIQSGTEGNDGADIQSGTEGNDGADIQSGTDDIQSGMEGNDGADLQSGTDDIQSGTEGNDGADLQSGTDDIQSSMEGNDGADLQSGKNRVKILYKVEILVMAQAKMY